MKNLLPFICIFFIAQFESFSQEVTITDMPDGITVIKETSEVLIHYSFNECNKPEDGFYADFIFIEIANKTNKDLQVNWFPKLYYNNKCTTCNKDNLENQYQITVPAKSTVSSNCDYTDDMARKLRIFIRWNQVKNQRTLTSFDLSNLTTTILPSHD